MPQTFQLRRGTAAEWAFANPILQAGEMGLDTSSQQLKVGDGVTRWSSLQYITGGASTGDEFGTIAISGREDGDVLRYSAGAWRNYKESLLVDGGNF